MQTRVSCHNFEDCDLLAAGLAIIRVNQVLRLRRFHAEKAL
jgi:hypothetical protein